MDSLFTSAEPTKDCNIDKLAFEDLFNRNYASLVYFSFNLVKDKREAEDIVQEAFISYWNHKQEVACDPTAVKSYLYTTVKNTSLNWLRHQKVIQKFQEHLPALSIEDQNIVSAMIHSEVIAKIRQALESLPAACRQITEMSYLDDKKNCEIAEELGISINTVKTQKQRAMQLLRQKLAPEMFSTLLFLFLD